MEDELESVRLRTALTQAEKDLNVHVRANERNAALSESLQESLLEAQQEAAEQRNRWLDADQAATDAREAGEEQVAAISASVKELAQENRQLAARAIVLAREHGEMLHAKEAAEAREATMMAKLTQAHDDLAEALETGREFCAAKEEAERELTSTRRELEASQAARFEAEGAANQSQSEGKLLRGEIAGAAAEVSRLEIMNGRGRAQHDRLEEAFEALLAKKGAPGGEVDEEEDFEAMEEFSRIKEAKAAEAEAEKVSIEEAARVERVHQLAESKHIAAAHQEALSAAREVHQKDLTSLRAERERNRENLKAATKRLDELTREARSTETVKKMQSAAMARLESQLEASEKRNRCLESDCHAVLAKNPEEEHPEPAQVRLEEGGMSAKVQLIHKLTDRVSGAISASATKLPAMAVLEKRATRVRAERPTSTTRLVAAFANPPR